MKNKITLFLTIFCALIIFLIYSNINEPLNVQNYIVNTYLYIALAIAIIITSWSFMLDYNIDFLENFTMFKFIVLCILSFGSLSIVVGTNNDNLALKHVAWTVLILTTGVMSFLFYKKNIKNNMLSKTIFELFAIIGVFTFIAYVYPPDTFLNWGAPLTYALMMMIIIEIINIMFFENIDNYMNQLVFTSWIVIILFCGFLLYDTQKIIKNGIIVTSKCKSKNQLICADYPKESLGIFLDILNLFERLSIINTK